MLAIIDLFAHDQTFLLCTTASVSLLRAFLCGLNIGTWPSMLFACSWMTAEGAIFEPARSAQNRTAFLATSDKRPGKGNVQASQLDSQVCSGGEEDGENGKHNGVRSILEGSTETSTRIWVHLH